MMVKRYVVDDLPEAVALIRRDLGRDAVILSTRKITQKVWMGLWRKRCIEVLAAPSDVAPVPTAAGLDDVEDNQALDQLRTQVADIRATLERVLEQSHEPAIGQQAIMKATSAMSQWLQKQGLESEELIRVFERGLPVQQDTGNPAVLVEAIQKLVPDLTPSTPIARSSRVVAFVGQTGVGKTTTVAKIAALQMLTGRKKVGLITTDTYRIAAVDQLRTYARILDVPFEVIHQNEELQAAVDKLHHCGLILIDTAGRNYGIDEYFEEVASLLEAPCIDEIHLVLSLTNKSEDLHRIARKFKALPVSKFLFTKLDETSSYATALELSYQYSTPVSYFTVGQSVPDDIEIASLERLLTLILEGAR